MKNSKFKSFLMIAIADINNLLAEGETGNVTTLKSLGCCSVYWNLQHK